MVFGMEYRLSLEGLDDGQSDASSTEPVVDLAMPSWVRFGASISQTIPTRLLSSAATRNLEPPVSNVADKTSNGQDILVIGTTLGSPRSIDDIGFEFLSSKWYTYIIKPVVTNK